MDNFLLWCKCGFTTHRFGCLSLPFLFFHRSPLFPCVTNVRIYESGKNPENYCFPGIKLNYTSFYSYSISEAHCALKTNDAWLTTSNQIPLLSVFYQKIHVWACKSQYLSFSLRFYFSIKIPRKRCHQIVGVIDYGTAILLCYVPQINYCIEWWSNDCLSLSFFSVRFIFHSIILVELRKEGQKTKCHFEKWLEICRRWSIQSMRHFHHHVITEYKYQISDKCEHTDFSASE